MIWKIKDLIHRSTDLLMAFIHKKALNYWITGNSQFKKCVPSGCWLRSGSQAKLKLNDFKQIFYHISPPCTPQYKWTSWGGNVSDIGMISLDCKSRNWSTARAEGPECHRKPSRQVYSQIKNQTQISLSLRPCYFVWHIPGGCHVIAMSYLTTKVSTNWVANPTQLQRIWNGDGMDDIHIPTLIPWNFKGPKGRNSGIPENIWKCIHKLQRSCFDSFPSLCACRLPFQVVCFWLLLGHKVKMRPGSLISVDYERFRFVNFHCVVMFALLFHKCFIWNSFNL